MRNTIESNKARKKAYYIVSFVCITIIAVLFAFPLY